MRDETITSYSNCKSKIILCMKANFSKIMKKKSSSAAFFKILLFFAIVYSSNKSMISTKHPTTKNKKQWIYLGILYSLLHNLSKIFTKIQVV